MIPRGILQDIFCRVWMSTSIFWMFAVASSYNLMFLTIERFLAITRPMQYDVAKVYRRLPFVLAMAWFMGVAFTALNW